MSICLRLKVCSWDPRIESHIGIHLGNLSPSAYVSASASLCISHEKTNKIFKSQKERTNPVRRDEEHYFIIKKTIKIKQLNIYAANMGVSKYRNHCWWECELVQPLWKTVWRFLKELKIDLPYDPAICLLYTSDAADEYKQV